ncbi:conjugative transposon protein TraN [Chitinophaga alhagiae]|uniref:conjugative transposon protein TraN n=1 Tax=Chitinophaga alhagiae TaxID=2203219 RepID=UPI000E5BF7A6|nr:conjugative transposon protein TraN [Chitinophaga alhagiae]
MKQSILALLFSFSVLAVAGQVVELPAQTEVIPYPLKCGYNKTTVLLFPAGIKDADRGRTDIIVSRQQGLNNVLKVKAGKKDFEPTNLNVFTLDGKLYTFEVLYSPTGGGTFDLSLLKPSAHHAGKPMPLIFPELEESSPDTQLRLNKVEAARPFFRLSSKGRQLKLGLQSIHFDSTRLYFHFRIRNSAKLPYQIDFSRMYITDGRLVRRSSAQQQEITPELSTGFKTIPGLSTADFIFVLKRFTIPHGKKFQLEFNEKNGGRSIRLEVRNRHLFRAKPLF